jgi:hypothetical protein
MGDGGGGAGKRAENEDTPAPTRKRKRPGKKFSAGNTAAVGKGRPRRDAMLDAFFEEVVRGTTKAGEPFEIERRRALLERLYTSAMDTNRKDQGRLLEVVCAYYFGKPRERLEMSGPGGGPIASADVTPVPRRRPTTGELRKELDGIMAERDAFVARKAAGAGATNGASTNGVHTPESEES